MILGGDIIGPGLMSPMSTAEKSDNKGNSKERDNATALIASGITTTATTAAGASPIGVQTPESSKLQGLITMSASGSEEIQTNDKKSTKMSTLRNNSDDGKARIGDEKNKDKSATSVAKGDLVEYLIYADHPTTRGDARNSEGDQKFDFKSLYNIALLNDDEVVDLSVVSANHTSAINHVGSASG